MDEGGVENRIGFLEHIFEIKNYCRIYHSSRTQHL